VRECESLGDLDICDRTRLASERVGSCLELLLRHPEDTRSELGPLLSVVNHLLVRSRWQERSLARLSLRWFFDKIVDEELSGTWATELKALLKVDGAAMASGLRAVESCNDRAWQLQGMLYPRELGVKPGFSLSDTVKVGVALDRLLDLDPCLSVCGPGIEAFVSRWNRDEYFGFYEMVSSLEETLTLLVRAV
jgi:hypothetical protein